MWKSIESPGLGIFMNACMLQLSRLSKLYASGGSRPIAARTWPSTPHRSPAQQHHVIRPVLPLSQALYNNSTFFSCSYSRHPSGKDQQPLLLKHFDSQSPFGAPSNMSNRIVPAIYKQVIEDVISAVREDFEEYGVDDNLVGYLQQLWEASLVQTRVAKFVDGDDEESEDEQPLRNGAVLPPPHQLSNMSRPGNTYTSEDVKPQIDVNGNGIYNGGLRGGADGTVRRLRGGAVGLGFGLGDGCS